MQKLAVMFDTVQTVGFIGKSRIYQSRNKPVSLKGIAVAPLGSTILSTMNIPFPAQRWGVVSEHSAKRDMPVGSPYCSDPNCVYCKELRELEEELRRKSRLERIEPTGESGSSIDS